VVCAPVLDLHLPETTAAIGDRSFGADPELVAALGRIVCASFKETGILPVIKHLPGHGRAQADSHVVLPRVSASLALLEATDFVPFRACREAPLAMTCHCLFEALDPDRPASLSAKVIQEVVRQRIGFHGLLLSDDLCMGALSGSPAERAQAALAAGTNLVLWCDGDLERTAAVLEAVPLAQATVTARLHALLAAAHRVAAGDGLPHLVRRLEEAIAALGVRDA
jgi:beta-N-acetylhexosaminidase